MLKFFDGQTDRVITIGHPPSGGALITTNQETTKLNVNEFIFEL